MYYAEDDLLMLSGIQHIAFCERQFALAYIESQWSENKLTIEGHQFHERVDDPFESGAKKDVYVLRAAAIVSRQLGLSGIADVIEFFKTPGEGFELHGKTGCWMPYPVEYKRGSPKSDDRDEVQLCAQAMCLEEMYQVSITSGALYYGETRHRVKVEFGDNLRMRVNVLASRMHELFKDGYTPLPVYKAHCKSCSLFGICLPHPIERYRDVNQYLKDEFDSLEQ